MSVPENLLFTKDHEWARIDNDLAVIGITDFAQSSLGDITFIDLPKVGQVLKQGDFYATVESVKAASDVYAPFSGEVVKVNEQLLNSPDMVNKSPYENGWFAVVKISDKVESQKLMSAADYKKYLESIAK